jgi:hypothetical protein
MTYTDVSGSWIVPQVEPSVSNEYSSTWIGIDGVDNADLIQTGTEQDTGSGGTSYFAWYEILPAPEIMIAEPVSPLDDMEATIYEESPGTWEIEIEDVTQGCLASGPFSYSGPGDSAEWIEEAPTVGGAQSTLANFGLVDFTQIEINGTTPSGTGLTPWYMVNEVGTVIASPGTYTSASDSFAILYGAPPPPTVTGISPTQGTTSGGTSVTIYGEGLADGAYLVGFGTTPASFTDAEAASGWITATAPTGQAGTVDVTVTTLGGTSATSAADRFTYTAPPPPPPPPPPAVSHGYDLVGSDGGVFVFSGGFYGSLPGLGVHVDDITGIVPTALDNGYFLVGSDGGVFAFNAPFANSLPGIGVHVSDIVGIVPTLNDQGYFLVGRDGGVFSFNAPFENSLPGISIHVNDITGIAVTHDDNGYWLVGSNGTVYAFGDATNYGSAPEGAVGITATHDGGGYWVVGADGAVSAFGDAGNFGDLPDLGVNVDNIVGIVVSPDSQGYNLFGSDGGAFSFGDATYEGSLPGLGVQVDNVVGAVPT